MSYSTLPEALRPTQDPMIEDDPIAAIAAKDTQTASRKPSSRKAYDPGKVGAVEFRGNGVYLVQSFTNRKDWYRVDLYAGTCGCKGFENHPERPDKHIAAARTECHRLKEAAREAAEFEEWEIRQLAG